MREKNLPLSCYIYKIDVSLLFLLFSFTPEKLKFLPKKKRKCNLQNPLLTYQNYFRHVLCRYFSGWLAIRAWIICYEMLSYYCQHTFQALTKYCSSHYCRKEKDNHHIAFSQQENWKKSSLLSVLLTAKKALGLESSVTPCFATRPSSWTAYWLRRMKERVWTIILILPMPLIGKKLGQPFQGILIFLDLEEVIIYRAL